MTQPPPPPGYEEPDAPEGYEDVGAPSGAGGPGFLDALKAFLGGAKSIVTAPVDAARGVAQGMGDPEMMGFDSAVAPGGATILKALAALGKMGQAGNEAQTANFESMSQAGGLQGLAGKALALGNKSPFPADSMMAGVLGQIADLSGSGATLAGVDFEPAEGMELSRMLKAGDVEGFMRGLGSTTAGIGALGLTGTTSALGRRLGLGAASKVAPGVTKAVAPLEEAATTTGISSPILRKNVFPGGPPARSMPVPELDVPMTMGERSGAASTKMLERGLESSLPATGSFEKLHAARGQKIYDYGKQVGQFISKDIKTAEGSGPAVSLRVQNRIAEAKQVLADNANKLYEELWSNPALNTSKGAPKKFSVKGTPMETVAKELIPELEAIEARIGSEGPALKVLRSFTTNEGKWASLSELQALKQAAFNSAETARLGISSGAARKLSQAIDDTIGLHIEKAGGKNLAAKWEVAKARYREVKQLDDDRFIKGVLANNKDAAYDMIRSGSIQDVDTVWKMLKPTDRQLVKARWIQDVVEEAGPLKTGSFTEFVREAAGKATGLGRSPDRLNPSKVKAGLSAIGPEKFQRLFTEPERAAIGTFASAVDKFGKGNVRSASGAIINGVMYFQLIQGLSGDVAALGKVGVEAAGINLLGKLLTSPKKAEVVSKYLEALSKAGSSPYTNPAVAFWGQRMAKEAQREE